MAKAWELLKKSLVERAKTRGFQSDFARRLGTKPQAIQRYFDENDQTVPSLDQAEKFAELLGVQLWELIKPDAALPTPAPKSQTVTDLLAIIDRQEKELEVLRAVAKGRALQNDQTQAKAAMPNAVVYVPPPGELDTEEGRYKHHLIEQSVELFKKLEFVTIETAVYMFQKAIERMERDATKEEQVDKKQERKIG